MIDRGGYNNSRPTLYTRDSGEINHHYIAWIKQAPRPPDRVQLHTATRRWLNRVDLARSRCHYGRQWPPRTAPDSVRSALRDEVARLVAGHERFLQRLLARSVPWPFSSVFPCSSYRSMSRQGKFYQPRAMQFSHDRQRVFYRPLC